jgi:hypothetical protein
MTSERVIHELRTFTVPATPGASERAVTSARDAYRRRRTPASAGRRRPHRIAVALVSVAAIVALSLTPAGHAATGWVTQLVGITHIPKDHPLRGHVGGRPTDPTSVGLVTPHPQVVIGNGRAPTGQPYEISVYRSPQNKYGACFSFRSPGAAGHDALSTGQCAWHHGSHTMGRFCIANSSGCGDAYRSGGEWTSPAIAAMSPGVARLEAHATRPHSRIRGVRIVPLRHKLQHEVGVSQPVKAVVLFVEHPARSPVRFQVTAYDRKGHVLGKKLGAVGPASGWREQHAHGGG